MGRRKSKSEGRRAQSFDRRQALLFSDNMREITVAIAFWITPAVGATVRHSLEAEARAALMAVKTADGATVEQVLKAAATLRPKEFQMQGIDDDYGQDGKPQSISACYWIGQNRFADETYCDIGFAAKVDGSRVTAAADPTASSASVRLR